MTYNGIQFTSATTREYATDRENTVIKIVEFDFFTILSMAVISDYIIYVQLKLISYSPSERISQNTASTRSSRRDFIDVRLLKSQQIEKFRQLPAYNVLDSSPDSRVSHT